MGRAAACARWALWATAAAAVGGWAESHTGLDGEGGEWFNVSWLAERAEAARRAEAACGASATPAALCETAAVLTDRAAWFLDAALQRQHVQAVHDAHVRRLAGRVAAHLDDLRLRAEAFRSPGRRALVNVTDLVRRADDEEHLSRVTLHHVVHHSSSSTAAAVERVELPYSDAFTGWVAPRRLVVVAVDQARDDAYALVPDVDCGREGCPLRGAVLRAARPGLAPGALRDNDETARARALLDALEAVARRTTLWNGAANDWLAAAATPEAVAAAAARVADRGGHAVAAAALAEHAVHWPRLFTAANGTGTFRAVSTGAVCSVLAVGAPVRLRVVERSSVALLAPVPAAGSLAFPLVSDAFALEPAHAHELVETVARLSRAWAAAQRPAVCVRTEGGGDADACAASAVLELVLPPSTPPTAPSAPTSAHAAPTRDVELAPGSDVALVPAGAAWAWRPAAAAAAAAAGVVVHCSVDAAGADAFGQSLATDDEAHWRAHCATRSMAAQPQAPTAWALGDDDGAGAGDGDARLAASRRRRRLTQWVGAGKWEWRMQSLRAARPRRVHVARVGRSWVDLHWTRAPADSGDAPAVFVVLVHTRLAWGDLARTEAPRHLVAAVDGAQAQGARTLAALVALHSRAAASVAGAEAAAPPFLGSIDGSFAAHAVLVGSAAADLGGAWEAPGVSVALPCLDAPPAGEVCARVAGLARTTAHAFQVASVSAHGVSPFSPSSAWIETAPAQAPPAPTAVTAEALAHDTVRLTWCDETVDALDVVGHVVTALSDTQPARVVAVRFVATNATRSRAECRISADVDGLPHTAPVQLLVQTVTVDGASPPATSAASVRLPRPPARTKASDDARTRVSRPWLVGRGGDDGPGAAASLAALSASATAAHVTAAMLAHLAQREARALAVGNASDARALRREARAWAPDAPAARRLHLALAFAERGHASATPSSALAANERPQPCLSLPVEVDDVAEQLRVVHPNGSAILVPAWAAAASPRSHRVRAEVMASLPFRGPVPRRVGGRDEPGAIRNSDELAGRVALFERGDVPLAAKVRAARNAGALAAVIIDTTGACDGDAFDSTCVAGASRADGTGFGARDDPALWAGVDVPVLLLSRAGGELLARAAQLPSHVLARLRLSATRRSTGPPPAARPRPPRARDEL